jgi:flagellar biosynthesis/type III secretory pathway protein FliH
MNKFNEIKATIDSIAIDVEKFYEKGNKAAAVRIRKAMQEVKKLAQDLRNDVQETKGNL